MRRKISAASFLLVCESVTMMAQEHPNILFCIADDASCHYSSYGCKWVNTPGFDRIAKEGILFSSCYTSNSKCAPSRATILTGRYSWQLQEAGNHISIFPPEIKVFTEVMRENGYQIAFTGKGWGPGIASLSDGKPRNMTGKSYQTKKMEPPTKNIGNNDYYGNFCSFLDDVKSDTPWFFWVGFSEPHRGYEFGTGEKLGGKTKDMIDKIPAYWPDNDSVRTDMLDYAFEIEYMDNHLTRILNELEKRGILDNTIVIYTSDNGMAFPRSKANNYEISMHMPLAVMWKNGIVNPGRKITDYINFVDFAPTFLEVSGIRAEHYGMEIPSGKSFFDIFKTQKDGTVTTDRAYTLIGRERHDYGRPQNQGYPIRGIIKDSLLYINNMKPELWPAGNPETGYLDCDGSPTKTLVLNMGRQQQNSWYYQLSMGKRPPEELYDLTIDIDCIHNLSENPKYSRVKKEMKGIMMKELRKHKDPRIVGNGDVFDNYPFDDQKKAWNFWERVQSGEVKEPWEQTGWVNREDYETTR